MMKNKNKEEIDELCLVKQKAFSKAANYMLALFIGVSIWFGFRIITDNYSNFQEILTTWLFCVTLTIIMTFQSENYRQMRIILSMRDEDGK